MSQNLTKPQKPVVAMRTGKKIAANPTTSAIEKKRFAAIAYLKIPQVKMQHRPVTNRTEPPKPAPSCLIKHFHCWMRPRKVIGIPRIPSVIFFNFIGMQMMMIVQNTPRMGKDKSAVKRQYGLPTSLTQRRLAKERWPASCPTTKKPVSAVPVKKPGKGE